MCYFSNTFRPCPFVDRHLARVATLVFVIAAAGCSTAPPANQESSTVLSIGLSSRVTPEQASDITIYAVSLVGTPYRHGGNTPDAGFDCSGLIGHVFKTRADLVTPRTVRTLQYWGQSIQIDRVRTGDVVVFAQNDVATHAGIYVGEGRFVHAPSTGGAVRLDHLNSKYWSSQRVSFRRP